MSRSFLPTRGDVFGGLSAGIVALPLCLAFGVASGWVPKPVCTVPLPRVSWPRYSVAPTPHHRADGTHDVGGRHRGGASRLPDGSINLGQVVLVFALAGGLQMLLGVLRLGGYIRYVPYPVISGFMTGIGVIIIPAAALPDCGHATARPTPWHIISNLHLLPGGVVWPVALLAW